MNRWNARKQTWKWNVSTFVIIHGVNVSVGFTPPRIDSIHYLTPILSARHFLLFLQTARNVNARFQWHVTNGNHVNSGRGGKKKEITFARHEIRWTGIIPFSARWIIIFRPRWITPINFNKIYIVHGALARLYFQSVYNSSLALTVFARRNFSHSIMILSWTLLRYHGISPRIHIKIIRNFESTNYCLLHRYDRFQLTRIWRLINQRRTIYYSLTNDYSKRSMKD